jgi:signal transduction histidine kinase/DNA-binding response OmpR family regulator
VCLGIFYYIYILNRSINAQKIKIEENNTILSLTNDLVYSVQQAQALTNMYISTQEEVYVSDYQNIYTRVGLIIDTLLSLPNNHLQYEKIVEIGALLDENESIISKLNKQFIENNPFDTIHQTILNQKFIRSSDSLLINAFRYDTTINKKSKRNFWGRLVDLFVPAKTKDTLLTVSTIQYDTINIPQNTISTDISNILADIQAASQQASKKYLAQLTEIRRYVNNLIISERQISEQISNLLLSLHRETINSILNEIEKSERILKKNYRFLLISGIISLLLILVFIWLIINDVNKGRAARKALEEANELTKRLMEERHKLLLSVSHDIKAPLTSILGYTDLWQQDSNISKELQGLSSVENSGKYILSLLDNLLEFSKLEQGTLEINKTNFHLETLCNETKEMFSPLIEKKQLDFEYDFSAEKTLWIHSDRLKIKQIIANIFSNAIKYTQKGKITFSINYTNNNLHFTITDTGAGIPEKELDKLFKPFSRVEKNNSLAAGSGFGLYVVKGFVDLLQGDITINSKENTGTSVSIHIPAEKAITENTNAFENSSKIDCLPDKKYKLLAIDDDGSLLSMLQEMIVRLGHEITVCHSLTEFEKQLPEISKYDFVLTDMEMGSFSGLDILQKVKETNNQIPVIVMTARGDFDIEKAINQGFGKYLSKPFSLKSLQELLGRKQKETNGNSSSSNSAEHFKLLSEMFDNDTEAVKNILKVFVDTTSDNMVLLQQCINEDNFATAQSLCHKMLPMYAQLEAVESVVILKKMDSMRGKNPDKYPSWKEDLAELIRLSDSLIEFIKEEYFTD